MTPIDRPAEVAEFAGSVPVPHRQTFTTLQDLIDELAPDADLPIETLRRVLTTAVERKRSG